MAKKEFFRERNIKEITSGRRIYPVGYDARGGLVGIIDNLLPSFALHVTFPIMRQRFNYINEARIGRDIELEPGDAIAKALHEAQNPFGSIVVRSRIDNVTVTRVVLDTCMKGMRLYAYSRRNEQIKVKWPLRFKSSAADFGVEFSVTVPAEEEGNDHAVRFSNYPLFESFNKKRLWTDIGAFCSCNYAKGWISGNYIKERAYCQHIIAAYYAIAIEAFKRGLDTPRWAVPFPIFSEEAVGCWKRMKTQVFTEKKGRKQPMNAKECSVLLGEYIKKQEVEPALWRKGDKRFIEYDW